MAQFKTLPGFREFYPEAMARRTFIFERWRSAARAHGFAEYDAPVLEPLDLYRAKSGDEIEAQLFSFTDKGGREVALRPEMTPTVCRLVGAKANALKRPIKWFSIADFFRYERMQKGRGRCFSQFNADIFGEAGPEAEIELIALLIQCLRGFGLTPEDFYVRLSDRDLWFFYLAALGFDEPQAKLILLAVDRFEKQGDGAFAPYEEAFGPLPTERREQVLSFLQVRSLPDLTAKLAPFNDARITERLATWQIVLDGLTAMGLADFVQVDMGVVRGLAYYTGFVFEAFDRKGELRALAGGGRYNDLVQKLGGPDMPAVGFAIGDMTFELLLEERGLLPELANAPEVFVVIGGETERPTALGWIAQLRAQGIRVEYPLRAQGFGKQFKAANESGAKVALIIGTDEVAAGGVKVRDLALREENLVPTADVFAAVTKCLGRG